MYSRQILLIYLAFLLTVISAMTGCRRDSEVRNAMNRAESLMETHPDSSLAILTDINRKSLSNDRERARYALLMSMALDKNYIDTTSFDVLQPAIDYYLEKGTPDERLRTLYYQACIYRNRGDDANAMVSCIEALQLNGVTDTLVLARLLVGQGVLYDKQYKVAEFTENNIRAAKLFQSVDENLRALRSYSKALNGAVILEMKDRADSLAAICTSMKADYPEMEEYVDNYLLSYIISYGSYNQLINILEKHEHYNTLNSNAMLDMAQGYLKIGEAEKALALFDKMVIDTTYVDSLKYYIVKSDILETAGYHQRALDTYKKYLNAAERFHVSLFDNDLLFAEKKHGMEISKILEVQGKDKLIRYSLFIIVALMIAAIIFILRYHKSHTKHILAEQDNLRLKLENRATELKLENLRFEKSVLETERNNLKEILDRHNELSEPLKNVIYQRLELLNGLIAKELTANDSYAVPYYEWLEQIRQNKMEFLENTRLAFTASNPEFMKHLERSGLTDEEIKYVCLYAIGLKGKEVGEYMQQKRYYNISSEIRKKLGIDVHETNLGLYIRRNLKKYDND